MANVNRKLMQRLQEVLNVGPKAVYRQISESNVNALEINLAALALAYANGIGIKRYSSEAERKELRPFLSKPAATAPAPIAALSVAAVSGARRSKAVAVVRKPKKDGSVFVVHGRNEKLRKALFEFLRSIGLEPMEFETAVQNAGGGNPYIEKIVRKAMNDVQVIIVLLTPDDEARLKPEFCRRGEKGTEGKLAGQARPNVLFEAGWAVGGFPEKTLLVQVGKLRKFTDIDGKHMLHLANEVAKRQALANRLRSLKCKVVTTGTDWYNAGDFRL